MKKLFIVIVLVAGALFHFKPELFSFDFSSSGAFDEKGNPEVLVFTSHNCGGWCNKGLLEIEKRQVPFNELSLDGNEANQKLYVDLGRGQLPYIVIGNQKVPGFYKGMIASALAQSYGEKYLTRIEKQYYSHHFYEDGSPMIYMYGASWCSYCKKMREEFAGRGMDYFEIDVEKTPDQSLLVDTMQIEGFPVIYVGYHRIQGADINQVLNAVKRASNKQI
ncbi:MAG: hypothetical protein OEY89_04520 [Gammaproteobacteria bacterium]|nr:hypothetical protein [Gammaproteobacteria bacterium]